MEIVAGIDGGGTGTTLEIRTLEGNILLRERYGPFNLNSIGQECFEELLTKIFKKICKTGECRSMCIGAAGISNPHVRTLTLQKAADIGLDAGLLLVGDHEIALYGANEGKAGGILIAGTGSICTGKKENGEIIRVGGYGHLIDDAGSGYAIGRDALSAVVRAEDGRGEKTCLSDLIREKWRVRELSELITVVYTARDKSTIASLSGEVERAARMGDAVANGIMQKAARELTELVTTLFERLLQENMELSLAGGLLTHDTLVKELLTQNIKKQLPTINYHAPVYDAAGGAVLMALNNLN